MSANSWDRFSDLNKQGFMRGVYAKPKPAKKAPPKMASCVGCQDWHYEGKHTKDAVTRKANVKADAEWTAMWKSGPTHRNAEEYERGEHPSPHKGDSEGFLYHATNHERAHDIATSGKLRTHRPHEYTDQHSWPDGSTEKRNYFSPHKDETHSFAPEEGKEVTLRVHHSKGEFHSERHTGDVYSKKPISAHHLEIEHNGEWHPLHKFFPHTEGKSPRQLSEFDEALEPHERRHLVLNRKGWQTSNGHTYTHSHLPGHSITSHPHSKEWTHHVMNPITKKSERHGSGTWPGGHSFTGYLNTVHDRAHTSKAPEWRPMPDRTSDCPHCAKGIPHTDVEHSRWTKKTSAFGYREGAYAQAPGTAPFQNDGEKSHPKPKKPAGKKEPVKEDRYIHHGHQRMHELLQSLGYRPEQPSTVIKREEIHLPAANYTRSTYAHSQWGDKAMVFSHPARRNVTVIVSTKDGGGTFRMHGKPETIYKKLGG